MKILSQNLRKILESTKSKEKRKKVDRNETHAINWNERWGANTYHEMTPFIVMICNKERERADKIFPEAATGYVFL